MPDWSLNESNKLILEIVNNSHVKKAIFVYNTKKEFIQKFEGVTVAQKELSINHEIIKIEIILFIFNVKCVPIGYQNHL